MICSDALAFEKTYFPEDVRPSGQELLAFITNRHAVSELFSPQVLTNYGLFPIVRDRLAEQDLRPDPPLPQNQLVAVKLAHFLYPGVPGEPARNEARDIIEQFRSTNRYRHVQTTAATSHAQPAISTYQVTPSAPVSVAANVSGFATTPQAPNTFAATPDAQLQARNDQDQMLAAIMQQNQALQATIAQIMGYASQYTGQQGY